MTDHMYGECPVCGVNSTFDEVAENDWCCPNCGYDPEEFNQATTRPITPDPHSEPLAVTEADGLHLPDEYIGHEGGLVVRAPAVTQQFNGWWGDAMIGTITPSKFGDQEYNPELAPDQVSLKKYGEDAEIFTVDLGWGVIR